MNLEMTLEKQAILNYALRLLADDVNNTIPKDKIEGLIYEVWYTANN
jgi:hypothetical protein